MSQWLQQKWIHIRTTCLIKRGCLTAAQAKRLDSLGLDMNALLEIRDSHTKEGFLQCLKNKGVRSEAARIRLQRALKPSEALEVPLHLAPTLLVSHIAA